MRETEERAIDRGVIEKEDTQRKRCERQRRLRKTEERDREGCEREEE